MFDFKVNIAGLNFHVHSLHDISYKLCYKYLCNAENCTPIIMKQEDIEYERQLSIDGAAGVDSSVQYMSDGYLETIALLRAIANHSVHDDRVLMHGSSIAINGKGYIFTALSGTGKSTHTALLRKLHGENAVMINDDKPFLHVAEDKVYIYGSPWMGKHNIGTNMCVPLEGIFFLRRSEENVLNEMSADDALSLLVSQCHRPTEATAMFKTLELLDGILNKVKLYDFGCNMDISAAELSSSVMK